MSLRAWVYRSDEDAAVAAAAAAGGAGGGGGVGHVGAKVGANSQSQSQA